MYCVHTHPFRVNSVINDAVPWNNLLFKNKTAEQDFNIQKTFELWYTVNVAWYICNWVKIVDMVACSIAIKCKTILYFDI